MIYTEAFDALPAAGGKAVVYQRLWAILSGSKLRTGNTRSCPPDRPSRDYRNLAGNKTRIASYFFRSG